MSSVFAPAQLPLAPKPLPDELLSSWLLRLAAANAISLLELLDGLRWRYPHSLHPGQLLDYSVPEATLQALSLFGRAPLSKLRNLDLSRRVPQVNYALLLRFPPLSLWCPRGSSWRVRYAFCPQCLVEQQITHIRWDWCFAALVGCVEHRSALLDACPACGAVDPLTFAADTLPPALCRLCGANLTQPSEESGSVLEEGAIDLIETAYRAALFGVDPHSQLLGKVTDRAFQGFVEDLLQILMALLSADGPHSFGSLLVPRRKLLTIIADLVRNAAPTTDRNMGAARFRRSLTLWSNLFKLIPSLQGETLERSSRHWPPSLRRRFASALYHRRRKRWPFTPFAAKPFSPVFRCNELFPSTF
jgi:hypothetical protein